MKTAMVLAAGRGERMRPLTECVPKPLLEAGGKPLLQYHLENLNRAGVTRIVINHARQGALLEQRFGDGRAYGVAIRYSSEGEEPLETGGGIKRALPLLGCEPFIVVNADIWTDYDFSRLPAVPSGLAHLVMVPNPDHHPQGDFALENGRLSLRAGDRLTYSGIGVYRPEFFAGCRETAFPLGPLLRQAVQRGDLTGEDYTGAWIDVGTPERLQALDAQLRSDKKNQGI
jgi:MurNAc alpha-1-phosphate uridylyltransferase